MARVRFSPNASSDALNDAFASGACRGAAARLAHFTKSAGRRVVPHCETRDVDARNLRAPSAPPPTREVPPKARL